MSRSRRWPVDVRPEERPLFLALFLHAMLNGIALVFFETPANTLFLVEVGAERLPLVYMATAVVAMPVGLAVYRLESRASAPRFFTSLLLFLLLSVLTMAGLAMAGVGTALVVALMVWKDILWVLLNMGFWGLAGNLLDLRQGKRLFGAINGGLILALVLGGAAVPVLTPFLGVEGLLLISAGALVGSGVVLAWVLRRFGDALEKVREESAVVSPEAQRRVLASPYVRLFVVVSGLSVVAAYLVDFLFLEQVQRALPDGATLATFFGAFFVGYGLLQILSSLVLVGPLLTRVGVAGALLLLPFGDLLGAGGVVVAALLGAGTAAVIMAVLLKLTDEVVRSTVELPAQRILYQVFPSGVRFKVQATVELGVEPMAGGVAGLLLVGVTLWGGAPAMGAVAILALILALWLGLCVALGREYPTALSRALSSHRLSPSALPWNDPATLEVVRRAIRSERPGEVIYGLEVLERLGEDELEEALVESVSHREASVRRYALERIEELRLEEAADTVRERIRAEEAVAVVAAAGKCLAVLKGVEDSQVYELLRDLRPRVRRETTVGLLRNGGPEALTAAEPLIYEMAGADEAEERALAAEAVGRGGGPFSGVLEGLLADRDGAVRSAAADAAGGVGDPEFIPLLTRALRDREVREAAGRALIRFGEDAVEHVEEVLEDRSFPSVARRRAAQVLGRVGGAGTAALFSRLNYPEEEVRLEVHGALADAGYTATGEESRRVWEQVEAEAEDAHWTQETFEMLRGVGGVDLLEDALKDEVERNLNRILFLLSLVLPREAVQEARTGIFSPSPVLRAQALELLETQVPRGRTEELLGLLERRASGARRGGTEAEVRRRLDDLILRPAHLTSSWARAAALHRVRAHPHPDHLSAVRQATELDDPVVRETAVWTAVRLDSEGAREIAAAFTQDQAAGVRRIADAILAGEEDDIRGRRSMRATVERVVILKSVSVFRDIPGEYLAELASSVEEVEVEEGTTVIRKGEPGADMYVIVDGRMRVHDGERTIAELGPREVFGELSALDPEVRSASVSALESSVLFRVGQRMLYRLMDERTEVAQRIISVLCKRLRNAVQ